MQFLQYLGNIVQYHYGNTATKHGSTVPNLHRNTHRWKNNQNPNYLRHVHHEHCCLKGGLAFKTEFLYTTICLLNIVIFLPLRAMVLSKIEDYCAYDAVSELYNLTCHQFHDFHFFRAADSLSKATAID